MIWFNFVDWCNKLACNHGCFKAWRFYFYWRNTCWKNFVHIHSCVDLSLGLSSDIVVSHDRSFFTWKIWKYNKIAWISYVFWLYSLKSMWHTLSFLCHSASALLPIFFCLAWTSVASVSFTVDCGQCSFATYIFSVCVWKII